MWVGKDYPDCRPGEDDIHVLDFNTYMAVGETVVTASAWSAAVSADSANPDPAAAALINGAASHDLTASFQRITFPGNNPVNVKYVFEATVVTSLGNTKKLHTHRTCVALI